MSLSSWWRVAGMAALSVLLPGKVPAAAPSRHASAPAPGPIGADFAGRNVSADSRQVAEWVVASNDNRGQPFIIVDKANAQLFLFAPGGALISAAPVLLGLARGDDSPPGIGDRPLAQIAPGERITPAGRFVGQLGVNLAGQDILWVDYSAAVSVHRATDAKEGMTAQGRAARLASATTRDNRISHGCIIVSAGFFEDVLRPAFAGSGGIVYVLPETRSIREEFPLAA